MRYQYPWIPDGEPLEFEGLLVGAKADLAKGVLKLTLNVPLTPVTFELRKRLAVIINAEMDVAIDVQVIRLQMERLADIRSAPAAPGQDRQYTLGDAMNGVLEEVAERVNAGELGPNVTATVGGRVLKAVELGESVKLWADGAEPGDGPPPVAGPEPQPTLMDAQVLEAADAVQRNGGASISLIQRKLRTGYHRAVEIIEELRKRGLIDEDGKPTKALTGAPEGDDDEQR